MRTKNSNQITKNKKILKNTILYTIFIIFIFYSALYQINNLNNKKYIQIFNVYISVTTDESMSPSINNNTLIIGTKINNKDIKENNIIGYDINGILNYHRLTKIKQEDGNTLYITKADNNYNIDIEEKEREQIKSKIILKIPFIGIIFKFLQTKIAIIIIVIILIFKFIINKKKIEISNKRKKKKMSLEKQSKNI